MSSDVFQGDGVLKDSIGIHKPRVVRLARGWTVWAGLWIYKANNFADAMRWAEEKGGKLCLSKKGDDQ